MAWWVILNHLSFLTDFETFSPTGWMRFPVKVLHVVGDHAHCAVDIFMIISGFVIFYLMDHQKASYSRFIAGRFFRLFPLYLACVLGAILVSPLEVSNLTHLVSPVNDFASRLTRIETWHVHFAAYFIPTALMLQGLIPERLMHSVYNIFLPPTWSLTLEWQFYLVAPLLYAVFRKQNRTTIIVLAIILACVVLGPRISWNRSLLLAHAPWFFVGFGSFYLFRHLEHRHRPLITSHEETIGCSLFVLLIVLHNLAFAVWATVFMAAFSPLIFGRKPWYLARMSEILNHRVPQFLGKVSYSTYLVHWLVIDGVIWVLLRAYPQVDSVHLFIYTSFLTVPLVILASFLAFMFIEKRGMELGKRWLGR